ncbi:geranylgeranylglyceryl/heptaprenylglyceryl phosphate synthase [bacterium]|nr:geranylgeranylglyceryl/heptaprenylglyceryl phosphate synthase [bacterium]
MNYIEKWFLDSVVERNGGLFLLIDPDRGSPQRLAAMAKEAVSAGADAVLVGSSILLGDGLESTIRAIKAAIDAPVFLFPGSGSQITRLADGILFLSLISGRNPRWLIEEQVETAPKIRMLGLPALPTAYMLVESGRVTAVEFMSATVPIPRDKPDIAAAHAMAAEMLGLKAIFLEAGSGAEKAVPPRIIAEVRAACDLPIIVGGGIREIDTAKGIIEAGADFVVIGNRFEETGDPSLLREISALVHRKR